VTTPPGQRQLQRRDRHLETAPAIRWRRLGVRLGDCQVSGRLVQAPLDKIHRGPHQSQLGVVRARRKSLHQRLDGLRLPVERQAERMVGEQPGRARRVTRRLRVPYRIDKLAPPEKPVSGAPMQDRHLFGQRPAQLQPQEIRKQVIVAEPGPRPVQRDYERVRLLQVLPDPLPAFVSGQQVGPA